MKQTAGTLLYRTFEGTLQVLLVHASGNYNRKAKWSIPKGLPEESETLEEAARRETLEETGVQPGPLLSLGSIDYKKSRKRVHCFYGPAPENASPACVSWEIDRAEFVSTDRAMELIHPDQAEFISRFLAAIQQVKVSDKTIEKRSDQL